MDAETKRLIENYVTVALETVLADTRARILEQMEAAKCESPLEYAFMAWWEALALVNDCRYISLRPQFAIVTSQRKEYRVDFLIVIEGGPRVAVELDGHAFHERTKEQVKLRDSRDRDLQADGWKVFHFSGSEIFEDCARCVGDVMAYARSRRPPVR